MNMASLKIDDFLSGTLVTWFMSCLEDPDTLTNYNDLVDGMLLHNVYLQINPEPIYDDVIPSCGDVSIRIRNLEMIIGNIRQFYEEELGNLIIKLPDPIKLGKEPESNIEEMELLLLLLLGCAVECPNKLNFITKIQKLDDDIQLSIVDYIKQITDYQDIIISQEAMDNVNMSGLFKLIKKLLHERDVYLEKWKLSSINDMSGSNESTGGAVGGVGGGVGEDTEGINKNQQLNNISKSEREENHHYAVELADWKSKVRKQRQELEEKTEALLECKEELEHTKTSLAKLKQENQELMHEARTAKSYRDELDAVMERAERADRLEMEVARYREKLTDIEFYKTRIEELREDNRVLMENREMLEEQLNLSRRRGDKVLELEGQLMEYKQLLNDIALERAADEEKYQELCEENLQLHKLKKAADDEVARVGSIDDDESDVTVTSDNRLSEQLTNNAQTRALKLELENRRLTSIIDSLKENSFHELSTQVSELKDEKKKLSLKLESLNINNERLTKQNNDLELSYKQAMEENKKLQNTLKIQRTTFERHQQDYQIQHCKIIELEKSYETVIKDKHRIQSLLESVQRRADELDRSLEIANQKLDEYRLREDKDKNTEAKCIDLESKIITLEKDKENSIRDINKYRELIEYKDVEIDKAVNTINLRDKKISELEREIENYNNQISRLQEIERSSKELDSQAAIDKETLETLKSNLIAEKMNTQQLYTSLEQIGLNIDCLLTLSPENIIDNILNLPIITKHIDNKLLTTVECNKILNNDNQLNDINNDKKMVENDRRELEDMIEGMKNEIENLQIKLNTSQLNGENLLEEQAKLQVTITTLKSKNTSLNSQYTALQLANSQLVAEKDELLKIRENQERIHQQLLHDQLTLQTLHEQLNNEYENLIEERENLKINLRDVKNNCRSLRETCERLESKNKLLLSEQEASINIGKSLNNLRGEHSKLKDDFRNLYSASNKLRDEYKNLQDENRKNKDETNRLTLKQTELQGELSIKDERISTLELELNKLNQHNEILIQMNSGLDNNRRSLMDHVSVLLNKYQDLLTRSLEDKEYYHTEEKIYRDQVNNLSRQKEKLEEKIMEYYRNKQSCSTKKRGFGANLVKRVRKAGSELLNKNRTSWNEDSKQSDGGKLYESESGGNESDISADERRPVDTSVGFENDSLSLGHPGTRRTVYYTDDCPSPATSLPSDQKIGAGALPQTPIDMDGQSSNQDQSRTELKTESRPLLIYNKVSAVINESKNLIPPTEDLPQNDDLPDHSIPVKDSKVGNSIWYEYGCV